MTQELDRLVDEIVKRVRDKLLERGLKPDNSLRTEVQKAVSGPELIKNLVHNGAVRISTSSETHEHSPREIASMIDHTLLKPDATEDDLKKLCKEARTHSFATVCVNSAFIPKAAELLRGSSVKPIAVVGFPLGAATSGSKAYEAVEAVRNGALEIDMVINIGELRSGNYTYVIDDIREVVEAAKPNPVKVILETGLLTYEEKVIACALSKAAGAAFVKTSTGFGPGGATAEDIALMRKVVGPEMGVKASGGIRTTEDAERMIEAGASRIGASASVAIVTAHASGNQAVRQTGRPREAPSGKQEAANRGQKTEDRKPFTGLPYKASKESPKSTKPKTDAPKGDGKKGGGY